VTTPHARWEALVRANQCDPNRALSTPIDGGLDAHWLYTRVDVPAPDPGGFPGVDPLVRGARVGRPWEIRQQHAARVREQANAEILEDLEGGVSELLLTLSPDGTLGIPVGDVDDLAEVLDGVLLDTAPVALDAGQHGVDAARLLLDLWRRGPHRPDVLRGSLRLDPVGVGALTGAVDLAQIATAVELTAEVSEEFPHVRTLAVDTRPYVEAGVGAVLELGLALATGITYLRAAEQIGVGADALAHSLEFTFVTGPDQFLEIAKLRAFRRLWSTVLKHCGVAAARRRSTLYTVTSRRMTSALDPSVNLLRATVAAFAAGLGGADGVTVLAFDEPIAEGAGSPGALGRRMARNTQLVLLEEAALHRVADPGGGAWYVESLTDELARLGWSEMQALERTGGVVAAIASGAVATRAREATHTRQEDLAHRRRLMTGVNSFPILADDEPVPDRAPLAGERPRPFALTPIRDAAQFEALRSRAAARRRRPAVLLACVGQPVEYVSSESWAKSFFEAGGIAVRSQPADRIELGGMSEAAVCGEADTDPMPTVAALRAAGAEVIYLIGATQPEAVAAGADLGVWDGVDMVAVLHALLDRTERVDP
jgi:methylmalonyl-CoA mutase